MSYSPIPTREDPDGDAMGDRHIEAAVIEPYVVPCHKHQGTLHQVSH